MRLRQPFVIGMAVAAITASLVVAAPAPEPVALPQPTPEPLAAFIPVTLRIPSLEVEAPVIPVGTEPDGKMSSPTNAVDVGWWAGSLPGEGNTLLAAHKDWKKQRGTFYSLADLAEGDEIIVAGRHEQLTFTVSWVKQVDADIDASQILGDQGEPVVTLITCGGPFDRSIRHYTERVVVRGELST